MSSAEAGRPVLVLVESNTTGTGRNFAGAARVRGLRPVVLSPRPDRYPWVAEDDVDVARADTTDPASVAALSMAAAEGSTLAGLVTSSEYFVAVTARAAARLGLPGPDPTSVDRCRDKRRQRMALRHAGVAVPAFAAASSPEAAVEAAAAIGFPVVVKPADGTGSRGVRFCPSAGEVRDHTIRLLAQRLDERGQPTICAVLVEEHVAGPEVSVETFGRHLVGVTAKHLGPLPSFVECGHDFPADPGPDPGAAAVAALAAVDALGLGFGAAHTEIRLGPRGPVIIEVNPRLAGGRIPTLVRLATGIDLVGATVDAAVFGGSGRLCRGDTPHPPGFGGGAPVLPEPGPGHASIRFVVPRQGGRVRRTAGIAAAAAVPGVVDVAISVLPGQHVGGTGSFLDRIGHVIAAAPTATAARTAAQQALALLRVDVAADDPASARPTPTPSPVG